MDLASILINLVLFCVSLGVLVYGADRFVSASEQVGLALGVPHFIMGITVLAVGTSFPELIASLYAVHDGTSEIVIGTVLGSNIANMLLILGVTAIFSKDFAVKWDLLHGDLPMLFGSLLLLAFVVYPLSDLDLNLFHQVTSRLGESTSGALGLRSGVNWRESLLLLFGYGLYLHYYAVRRNDDAVKERSAPDERPPLRWSQVVWILVGLAAVLVGAKYTVTYSVALATGMGMGSEIIAASLIALGTSMPEMMVSISAARRNNFEMALGNVTGSNLFNTFVVLGLPALLSPLMGNHMPLRVGNESVLFLQMPFYAATMLLFMVIMLDKQITRTEGGVLVTAYVLFICKLFNLL